MENRTFTPPSVRKLTSYLPIVCSQCQSQIEQFIVNSDMAICPQCKQPLFERSMK